MIADKIKYEGNKYFYYYIIRCLKFEFRKWSHLWWHNHELQVTKQTMQGQMQHERLDTHETSNFVVNYICKKITKIAINNRQELILLIYISNIFSIRNL